MQDTGDNNDLDDSTPLLRGKRFPSYDNHSASISGSHHEFNDSSEFDIRKKMQWYFKNPYEKYKERKRKPGKLVLQIIKIIIVTAQAVIFATDEFSLVNFRTDNIETFRQLFMLDYVGTPVQELFLKDNVYKHMHHTWKQYYKSKLLMIGAYHKPINAKEVELCVQESVITGNFAPNRTYPWSKGKPCYLLKPPKNGVDDVTWQQFKEDNLLPQHFELISNLKMLFEFQVNYTILHRNNAPDCYQFNITVFYDNEDLDGVMSVKLNSEVDFQQCRETSGIHIKERNWWNYNTVFDIVVILICIFSFMLCIRSFKRHYYLSKDAEVFFREYRHEKFTFVDKFNFLNFWIVLIASADICIITGSCIKIALDWLEYPELYDACGLLFGTAVLFSWVGILRYLGFMKGYNILLVTLKTSFPSILRFIFCVSFIYLGFTICGWIVLGPYHYKFINLWVTSECLFSLVNGDDMYMTFHTMDLKDTDPLIWYFNKVYLYTFISLFIFVVLSLFIGIVGDTYERIKDYGHAPKTRVELFIEGREHEEPQHRHGGVCKHHDGGHENRDNVDENDDGEGDRSDDGGGLSVNKYEG